MKGKDANINPVTGEVTLMDPETVLAQWPLADDTVLAICINELMALFAFIVMLLGGVLIAAWALVTTLIHAVYEAYRALMAGFGADGKVATNSVSWGDWWEVAVFAWVGVLLILLSVWLLRREFPGFPKKWIAGRVIAEGGAE